MMTLVASACASGTQPTPVDATELAYAVYSTQTAMAAASTVTAVVAAPTGTNTSLPSETPQPEATTTLTATLPPTTTPSSTPSPNPENEEDCTNSAKFIEETIPDGTTFASGETFVKTWKLQNTGTCTWSTDYSLVFDSGDRLGVPDSINLDTQVAPNTMTELSIEFTAPASAGVYQSDWMLSSAAGTIFGVGKKADEPFWVQIEVVQSVNDLGLGEPTAVETFNSATSVWPLGEDDNLRYEIADGKLLMTAREPIGDQWRINYQSEVSDLYLQAEFITGKGCSGKDSYGLIIRSTAQDSGIYNNGYIYTFSCDGNYRLYRLTAGEYVSLLEWTPTVSLHTGPNQPNQMGIWAKGDLLMLYVNGKKVAEVLDGIHPLGYYGLVVRAEGEQDFQVAVDEVRYWDLR